MIKEFKQFIMRGNVLDLAVGIIIGGAFGKIISSLVDDIIMPPIGLLLGKVDFANLYHPAGWQHICFIGRSQGSRSGYFELWLVYQYVDQLSDRRICHIPLDQTGQPAAKTGRT